MQDSTVVLCEASQWQMHVITPICSIPTMLISSNFQTILFWDHCRCQERSHFMLRAFSMNRNMSLLVLLAVVKATMV